MKKTSLFLIFILALFIPGVSAQEALIGSIPADIQKSVPAEFSVTVLSNGQLMIQPGEVFTAGEEEAGTVLPYLISAPKPVKYPKEAFRQGWEGKVTIALEILADGSVGQYQVMQSSGYDILDKTAVSAAKTWKFHPAVHKDGKAFRTCIQIPITFQIQEY